MQYLGIGIGSLGHHHHIGTVHGHSEGNLTTDASRTASNNDSFPLQEWFKRRSRLCITGFNKHGPKEEFSKGLLEDVQVQMDKLHTDLHRI